MTATGDELVALSELIDLERYPINALDTDPRWRLILRCRKQLATTGLATLGGFLRAEAVAKRAAEALALSGVTFRNEDTHNVYFEEIDPTQSDKDPRRPMQRSAHATVAFDQIPLRWKNRIALLPKRRATLWSTRKSSPYLS